MQLINAEWEKRNIGVSCQELCIEASDSTEEIYNFVKYKLSANYQVIKLPVTQPNLIIPIQELGFNFIEIIYECIHNLEMPELNRINQRIVDNVKVLEADKSQIVFIYSAIQPGLFISDRVSIDPTFGQQASAKRYAGWIEDLAQKPRTKFYLLWLKNDLIGFYVLDLSKKYCDGVIGGMFNNRGAAGLGFLLNYFQLLTAKSLGFSELRSYFSSNNNAIFKINSELKYKIIPKHYVFISHRNEKGF